jgi:hypothetical protein
VGQAVNAAEEETFLVTTSAAVVRVRRAVVGEVVVALLDL